MAVTMLDAIVIEHDFVVVDGRLLDAPHIAMESNTWKVALLVKDAQRVWNAKEMTRT